MANLLLKNILDAPEFTWGGNVLTQEGCIRKEYIQALQAADNGDYSPLRIFVRT
jgi:hypothetical protein